MQDREIDAALVRKRRAARTQEKKMQDREIDAAARRSKRGATYADHRLNVETKLRRYQAKPQTS